MSLLRAACVCSRTIRCSRGIFFFVLLSVPWGAVGHSATFRDKILWLSQRKLFNIHEVYSPEPSLNTAAIRPYLVTSRSRFRHSKFNLAKVFCNGFKVFETLKA